MGRSFALVGMVATAVLVAACSEPERRTCVRDGEARVCARSKGGSTTIEGSGLRPGSELRLVSPESTAVVTIADAGRIDGGLGYLRSGNGRVLLTVEATTATGAPLVGRLRAAS